MENLHTNYMGSSSEREDEEKDYTNGSNQEPGWESDESSESFELRRLFEHELNGIYCIEGTLMRQLPDLIKYVTLPALLDTLTDHLHITYKHVVRLQEIHDVLGIEVKERECEIIKSILREAQETIEQSSKGIVRDIVAILAEKKIEQYEISIYDTLYAYAMILGERKVAFMLNQNLEDEKKADLDLTEVL